MKKLFVLAALLTVGALSANAQTGTTTTTTHETTTVPATPAAADQTAPAAPAAATTTTTTTEATATQPATVPAETKNGTTEIKPAEGAKVKSNGKRVKVK